uniref:ZP-C domain-containing protein n=1 Tax=Xiphophorus maculatus TaxID=8083 RepID=A0A3B5R1S2_XIPMA
MSFRAAVLLLSGGNLCAAAQNSLVTNETASQTPRKQVTTSSQQATQLSPVTLRLETYQLRNLSQSGEETKENLLVQGLKLNLSSSDPVIFQVVKPERPVPAPAETVLASCAEEKVTVAVKKNFLGNGQLIQPNDLIYFPTPVGNVSILRTNPVDVPTQCHFQSFYVCLAVSSMRPLWTTFAFEKQTEQQLHFALRLMTEDWRSLRASNVYSVRETMQVEASVMQGFVPMRVFVDKSKLSKFSPQLLLHHRQPRVKSRGLTVCLTDSKLTGAQSYFTPRSQEDKLHFQLKAFKFIQDDRSEFYITSCSFLTEAGRWVASGGDNKVCSCCETSCGGQMQRRSPRTYGTPLQWDGMVALGPILLEDGLIPTAVANGANNPHLFLLMLPPSASYSSIGLLCGAGVTLAVVMGFVSTLVCSRLHKPAGYSVCT